MIGSMTLEKAFKEHPTRRKELAALLMEPVMQDAINILRDRCFTIKLPPAGGTYSLNEYYGLYGAKSLGYLECLTNLLDLAKITPTKKLESKPWETLKEK